MSRIRWTLLLIAIFISYPARGSVDLHMHMTMEVPLQGLYSGHILQSVSKPSESSRFESRVDFTTLGQSGLQVVVAALIANPLWGDPQKQLEEQIRLLREFCEQHPSWLLVSEPDELLKVLKGGKKAILLSLEGAWVFKDKASFEKFLDRHPIRFVTPFHFTDMHSVVGKPAQQRGFAGWIQRLVLFFSGTPKPLSAFGEDLLTTMLERKIWVDLSHASNEFTDYFLERKPKGYPILVSHTILAKYYATDRGLSERLLRHLKTEPGAVGLLPSAEMLVGTPADGRGDCSNGQAFLVQWKELVADIGREKVYLGSDLNSPIPMIPRAKKKSNCPSPFLKDGLVTAKDLKEIVDLQARDSAINFARTWKLVRP